MSKPTMDEVFTSALEIAIEDRNFSRARDVANQINEQTDVEIASEVGRMFDEYRGGKNSGVPS